MRIRILTAFLILPVVVPCGCSTVGTQYENTPPGGEAKEGPFMMAPPEKSAAAPGIYGGTRACFHGRDVVVAVGTGIDTGAVGGSLLPVFGGMAAAAETACCAVLDTAILPVTVPAHFLRDRPAAGDAPPAVRG